MNLYKQNPGAQTQNTELHRQFQHWGWVGGGERLFGPHLAPLASGVVRVNVCVFSQVCVYVCVLTDPRVVRLVRPLGRENRAGMEFATNDPW